jgi:hypothetical protein
VVLDISFFDDWTTEAASDYLRKVRLWHTALKPNVGTFVMNRHPVPHNLDAAEADGLHISKLGFDSFRLEPLVEAMKAARGS